MKDYEMRAIMKRFLAYYCKKAVSIGEIIIMCDIVNDFISHDEEAHARATKN